MTDTRGYLPRGEELQKIHMGMSKTQVQTILGSPSTTATLNHQGDSFYYVSSKVETKSFFHPKILEREVVAIRFDQSDKVAGFGHYGLEDGKVVNFSSRETPVEGKEESLIRDFFGNLGKYEPGAGGGGNKGGI
ncbi:MAG: outer membrane protein assembly factor BamE [Hyphomicrobiales bacterium]